MPGVPGRQCRAMRIAAPSQVPPWATAHTAHRKNRHWVLLCIIKSLWRWWCQQVVVMKPLGYGGDQELYTSLVMTEPHGDDRYCYALLSLCGDGDASRWWWWSRLGMVVIKDYIQILGNDGAAWWWQVLLCIIKPWMDGDYLGESPFTCSLCLPSSE